MSIFQSFTVNLIRVILLLAVEMCDYAQMFGVALLARYFFFHMRPYVCWMCSDFILRHVICECFVRF